MNVIEHSISVYFFGFLINLLNIWRHCIKATSAYIQF